MGLEKLERYPKLLESLGPACERWLPGPRLSVQIGLELPLQDLPFLSKLFCFDLMGTDQLEKGRSRNSQKPACLLGRQDLLFYFFHGLPAFVISSNKKPGLRVPTENPLIRARCLFGNTADLRKGPVAFRPTLTDGLALFGDYRFLRIVHQSLTLLTAHRQSPFSPLWRDRTSQASLGSYRRFRDFGVDESFGPHRSGRGPRSQD